MSGFYLCFVLANSCWCQQRNQKLFNRGWRKLGTFPPCCRTVPKRCSRHHSDKRGTGLEGMRYSWQPKAPVRGTIITHRKTCTFIFSGLIYHAEQNCRERSCLCAFVSLLNHISRKCLTKRARSEPRGDGGLMQGSVSCEAALQWPHAMHYGWALRCGKNPFLTSACGSSFSSHPQLMGPLLAAPHPFQIPFLGAAQITTET